MKPGCKTNATSGPKPQLKSAEGPAFKERRETAYHEAGHGVAAVHFDIPIRRIDIDGGALEDGCVDLGYNDIDFSPYMQTRARVFRRNKGYMFDIRSIPR